MSVSFKKQIKQKTETISLTVMWEITQNQNKCKRISQETPVVPGGG